LPLLKFQPSYDDHDEDDHDDDEIQLVICELCMNHPRMTYRVIRKLLTHIRRHFMLKHRTAAVPELFRFTAPLVSQFFLLCP